MTESFGRLRGRSEAMLKLFKQLREVAGTDATVLLIGETGTGKELAAEAIHDHSPRKSSPYIVVDCAAIPKDLIESELFGHMRGAFTSALSDRKGAFEAAEGGTVFIDEIGELPLDLQSRILRVLERRQIKRIGENVTRNVDVRVVAATNRNLEKEIELGRFRQDLYFRLNVVKVDLPPLRTRPEDIELLTRFFLEQAPSPLGLPLELKEEALLRLKNYSWPGNVRELRNIVDRGASMSDRFFRIPDDLERSLEFEILQKEIDEEQPFDATPIIPTPSMLPEDRNATIDLSSSASLTVPLWKGRTYKEARDAVLEDFERGYIHALLEEHKGNVSAAARAAGIHRNILHRMMARYGIQR